MRFAALAGRAVVVVGDRALDVHRHSAGRFGPDPQALFEEWDAVVEWAAGARSAVDPADLDPLDPERLGAPVPRPRQVFAIGVNYTEHAAEAGYPSDSVPVTFTKFPSCIVGPDHVVELPSESVDWEIELVVAIARTAHRVSAADAWSHVAGVTIGQDLSERVIQMVGTKPQFSLGKSFPGFGPTGPWLVTPDELPDRDDLELRCELDGERVQTGRTSQMIYTVPQLIERLSAVVPLLPGDLIFTGTPSGIGNARTPKRFLQPEERLTSAIDGIGVLETRFRRA
ncbi:fumarylacetoacetate hydrolase family protein [Galbitalea soli]|uniref:Fumarylacetoacetate hydrolase family protein n=1 Tax=Galbitalea soli TaxID=1268042 RepID=A0A7C9TT19_9MICO|nr:fumarylacetoacetate hydrolase family protein [Galbitalea soli]NYJ31784.1 2-keto-4-pentenoate hydratase/2-oxohepta-3-ene-1,7-dioic acid hydratase in catechol pathway [Galbitalea soli]